MADSITCPRCGATSHNPHDIEQGYCGACHDFTSGESSTLAFEEWLATGKIPEWRKQVLKERGIQEALHDALSQLRGL